MTFTRDSLIWFVALGAAIIAYLMAAEKPPNEWNYREWLQAAAAAFAAITTKLQGSPLPLSYAGRAKHDRGEFSADIPPPAEAKRKRKERDTARRFEPPDDATG